jgi:3-deoxy-D-arabino-heptulosonate 7-phosphate (DAHP) synthase
VIGSIGTSSGLVITQTDFRASVGQLRCCTGNSFANILLRRATQEDAYESSVVLEVTRRLHLENRSRLTVSLCIDRSRLFSPTVYQRQSS